MLTKSQNVGPSPHVERATSILKLSVSCRNLPKSGLTNNAADVMMVLAVRAGRDGPWKGYLRTERIKGKTDIDFETPLELPWHLHADQSIRFAIVDMFSPHNLQHVESDELGNGVACHDTTMADMLCNLSGDVYSCIFHTRIAELNDDESCHAVPTDGAVLRVRVTEKEDSRLALSINMALSKSSQHTGSKWRPVLRIYGSPPESGDRTKLFESPLPGIGIRSSKSFDWPEIVAKLQHFCNGNTAAHMFFEVSNYLQSDEEERIGFNKIRVFDLLFCKELALFDYNNSKRKTGKIKVRAVTMKTIQTLFSRLLEGNRLSLFVGIDFTASNGEPDDPISLHYLGPSWYGNPYIKVMKSVAPALEAFDPAKKIMAFAFGCSQIYENYCRLFPISKNRQHIPISGISQLIEEYKDAVTRLVLSGPGLFAPLINCAADNAEKQIGTKVYSILLIIADGIIPDNAATNAALQRALALPISLVIFGVGKADFSELERFCVDFTGEGRFARNFITFLRLDDFENCAYNSEVLAQAALHAIPDQLVEYYTISESKD